jgi:DMSO/TMAO reductase YedYZ heme-binding membrane subunit
MSLLAAATSNPDPVRYGWWLASRAAGVTAILFVTASTILGLTMASGIITKRGIKAKLMPAHEYLALVSIVAIAIHGLSLLGDKWLHPGVAGIFVPFAIAYRPIWVAIGIIAGYTTFALALSFYGRKYIGVQRWRKLHRLIVVVWVMGIVHALGAGTDSSTLWLRIILMASVAPAMFLTLYRWLPEAQRDRDISAPDTHGGTVVIHPHEAHHERSHKPQHHRGDLSGVTIPAPQSQPARKQVVIPAPPPRTRRSR